MNKLFIKTYIIVLSFFTLSIFCAAEQLPELKSKAILAKHCIVDDVENKYAVALTAKALKAIESREKIKEIKASDNFKKLLERRRKALKDYRKEHEGVKTHADLNTMNEEGEYNINAMPLGVEDLANLKKTIFFVASKNAINAARLLLSILPIYGRIESGIIQPVIGMVTYKLSSVCEIIKENTVGGYSESLENISKWQAQVLQDSADRMSNLNEVIADNPQLDLALKAAYDEIDKLSKECAGPGVLDVFRAKFMQEFMGVSERDYKNNLGQALLVASQVAARMAPVVCDDFMEEAKKFNMLDLIPKLPISKFVLCDDMGNEKKFNISLAQCIEYLPWFVTYVQLRFLAGTEYDLGLLYANLLKIPALASIVNRMVLQASEEVQSLRAVNLGLLALSLFGAIIQAALKDTAKMMFYLGDIDDVFPGVSNIWRPVGILKYGMSSVADFASNAVGGVTALDEDAGFNGLIFTMIYYNAIVSTILILNNLSEKGVNFSQMNIMIMINKLVNANTMLFMVLLNFVSDSADFCKSKLQGIKDFYDEGLDLRAPQIVGRDLEESLQVFNQANPGLVGNANNWDNTFQLRREAAAAAAERLSSEFLRLGAINLN